MADNTTQSISSPSQDEEPKNSRPSSAARIKQHKLSKLSTEELSEVAKRLAQRKSKEQLRQSIQVVVKQKRKQKLKQLKYLKKKRNIKIVDSRSFESKCLTAGTDKARQFIENRMSSQERVSLSSLKRKKF